MADSAPQKGRPNGRRSQTLGQQDLAEHIQAATDLVGVETSEQPLSATDLISWTAERWITTTALAFGRVPRADLEHIREILRGNQPFTAAHLQHLHHVLGLHEFDLDWRDVWLEETPAPRLRSLESFKEKLAEAADRPRNPLRYIKQYANSNEPWIGVATSTTPRPVNPYAINPMIFMEKHEPALRVPANTIALKPGTWVDLEFTTAVPGRVLLLEQRHAAGLVTGRIRVLNDFPVLGLAEKPGQGRGRFYGAHQRVKTAPFFTNKTSARYTLICLNWPDGLNEEELGLGGLFRKRASEASYGVISNLELRNIGLVMKRTAEDRQGLRLRAGVRELVIDRNL